MNDSAEEIIEPALPIIDPHHHLLDRPGLRYLFHELLADLTDGHCVQQTGYVECVEMYKVDGPKELRPIGETEFVNGVAAMSASGLCGGLRACAAIVGFADLQLGEAVRPVLEAQMRAGGGRFRGIRHLSVSDEDETLSRHLQRNYPPGLLLDPTFQKGFAQLAPLGLSFDALLYFHQLADLTSLARTFPETSIVLDHIGLPIGVGRYSSRRKDVFDVWKALLRELAREPNVFVKLGGLGMPVFGFDFHTGDRPPTSVDLAEAWGPYIETCIEAFGTDRCMFESNFPVDRITCSYRVLWNSFKRIAANFSPQEKTSLFSLAAAGCYRLDAPRESMTA